MQASVICMVGSLNSCIRKAQQKHVRCLYSGAGAVQGASCMYIKEAGGFDWMLCFSIISSLGSSALCFMYLDMNDHRFGRDRLHQAELAALLCYRTAELSARITLLALFAVRVTLLLPLMVKLSAHCFLACSGSAPL